MSVVMKVSKPGYDVKTADNENLSFHSELATHSIYNIVTFTKPSGLTEITYTHELGYTPKTWVFVLAGTAPSDYLRRVPTIDDGTVGYTDYYITNNQITCYGESASDVTFTLVVFTRNFTP